MMSNIKFRDNRKYLQVADILSYVLNKFDSLQADHFVLDFFRPSVANFDLVMAEQYLDSWPKPFFSVKVLVGSEVIVFKALPIDSDIEHSRFTSTQSLASEKYFLGGFEVISEANTKSNFFYDCTLALKNYAKIFNEKANSGLIRRIEINRSFVAPQGRVRGQLRELKRGVQAWDISSPETPEAVFSLIIFPLPKIS